MRIELNAGGLGGTAAISGFHTDYSGLISKSKKALSVFQVVRQQSYNMNGGIGNLQSAVNEIETRISAEEAKVAAIETVEKKTNSFLELAIKTDIQASVQVNRSKNEFYRVNPWAKPPAPPEEKKWYHKAGEWLYNKGKEAVDGIKKAWNNVKEWCSSNIGRIVLGVVAVIGAIAIIATVIASGGLALVPLLTAIGCSAGVATAISMTVGAVAVVSTALALIPNTLDLAAAVDEVVDPASNKISDFNNKLHQNAAYNAFQNITNKTSAITGGIYSIGSLYNGVKGVSNAELKTFKAQNFTKSEIKLAVKQDAALKQYAKAINNSSNPNLAKGNYGEMLEDKIMRMDGYKRISNTMVTDYTTKFPPGIDGVYERSGQFVIGEAKYGTSQLGHLVDGTKQMSSNWIMRNLSSAVGDVKAFEITTSGYVSELFRVDSFGSITRTILNDLGNILSQGVKRKFHKTFTGERIGTTIRPPKRSEKIETQLKTTGNLQGQAAESCICFATG